ncbi:MAG: SRPBCC family protein [Chloroflexota bacterium]
MKPIKIKITGMVQKSSQEICSEFLDTERWSKFKGYSILPGIKNAHFVTKTPDILGSRIIVHNTDGSSHVEEIIEWEPVNKISLRFQEFDSPLKYLATHFIEAWNFRKIETGTEVTRTMSMFPTGMVGWLMLIPISQLMKKAFLINSVQLSNNG